MILDLVFFDEGDEIARRIATQGRYAKTGVGGDEARWLSVDIGEITSAAARHEYFLANLVGTFKNENLAAPFAGCYRAQQAGRASAQNDYIKVTHRAVALRCLST